MRIFEIVIKVCALLTISFTYIIVLNKNSKDLKLVPLTNQVFLEIILPKYHGTVNQLKSEDDLNYNKMTIQFGNYTDYQFQKFIGKGASGNAYLGKQISTNTNVVIKTFKQIKWSSIKREISFMQNVEGHPNISPLFDIITNKREVSLVYQRLVTVSTSQLFESTNDQGNKYFMFQTFQALDHAHSKGIIHGDMKPANIITNPLTKMLKLIDWGLSLYFLPGKSQSTSIGTRSYKSPELLLGYRYFDYNTDIFSIGLMFSNMIFKENDPFKNQKIPKRADNIEYLNRLGKVLGSSELLEYAQELQSQQNLTQLKEYKKQNLKKFITKKNREYCSDEAIDLLEQMLQYNYTTRIAARDALKHPYFDSIRKQI